MAWITLESMRFHAFHGVYPEEAILGTEFIVDLSIETSTGLAALTDDLAATVNYETIFQAVKIEMETRHALLETLIAAIEKRLKFQFQTLNALKIKVKKMNPPLGGQVGAAIIEDENVYQTACPRCNRPMICYDDETCWCQSPSKPVYPATQERLKIQYKKCLCPTCLAFFAG